jgi:hypothetical protein
LNHLEYTALESLRPPLKLTNCPIVVGLIHTLRQHGRVRQPFCANRFLHTRFPSSSRFKVSSRTASTNVLALEVTGPLQSYVSFVTARM